MSNKEDKKYIAYTEAGPWPEYIKPEGPEPFEDRVVEFKKKHRVSDTSEDIARLRGEIQWKTEE